MGVGTTRGDSLKERESQRRPPYRPLPPRQALGSVIVQAPSCFILRTVSRGGTFIVSI